MTRDSTCDKFKRKRTSVSNWRAIKRTLNFNWAGIDHLEYRNGDGGSSQGLGDKCPQKASRRRSPEDPRACSEAGAADHAEAKMAGQTALRVLVPAIPPSYHLFRNFYYS